MASSIRILKMLVKQLWKDNVRRKIQCIKYLSGERVELVMGKKDYAHPCQILGGVGKVFQIYEKS